VRPNHSALFRYPWREVAAALAAAPPRADGARELRYVDPETGGPVMPTINCHALRLGDAPTRAELTTATTIAVVIEGEGESRIGESTIRWGRHDVFTLPRWQWIEHRMRRGPATLFMISDRELLRLIGQLRIETAAP
jgi:gentisate 1,2-dioxygenase